MSKKAMEKEHEELIPILRRGNKKQLKREATKQEKEMDEKGIKLKSAYRKWVV